MLVQTRLATCLSFVRRVCTYDEVIFWECGQDARAPKAFRGGWPATILDGKGHKGQDTILGTL
jgi:hypothetical protein